MKTVGLLFNFLVAFEANQGVTLIDPNRTVSDIIKSNENAKHFEKIKRLAFKADKCKSLYINYGKEHCIELDINVETAESVLIECRVNTGKQKIGVIQAFCKEIALGNYEIHIMLEMYLYSIFCIYILEHCALQLSIMDKLNKHTY